MSFALIPAVGIALLEGFALALLFPIIETIADGDQSDAGENLGLVSRIFGIDGDGAILATAGGLVVALLLAKSAFGAGFTWLFLTEMNNAEARLATRLFSRYVRAPVTLHRRSNSADALRALNSSLNSIVRSILIPATLAVGDLVVLFVIAAVLLAADPLVSAITGAYLIFASLGFVAGLSNATRTIGQRSEELNAQAIRQVQEGLNGVKTIQSMSLESYFDTGYRAITDALRPLRRRNVFFQILPRYYLEAMLVVGAVIIAVTASTIIGGDEAVAYVGLVIAAALRALAPTGRVIASVNSMRVAAAGVSIVTASIANLDRAEDHVRRSVAPGTAPKDQLHAELALRDVGYVFEDGRRALEGIDLDIPRGESLAIVGPSGGGKSTLAAIIAGLLAPTEGTVIVDGQPLGPAMDDFKGRIGFVPQSAFLTDEPLRNNVAFGVEDEHIDDAQVEQALLAAGLGEFVAGLPAGLSQSFGEGGVQLSGGQRQRITIARALYRSPSILVLDEATAALDPETEQQITDLVDSLAGDRTVVRVAHRIQTTRRCRRIVLLTDGQIAGIGSFEQLQAGNDLFRSLAQLEDAA